MKLTPASWSAMLYVAVAAAGFVFSGCREKAPYPGPETVRRNLAAEAAKTADDRAAAASATDPGPVRMLAIVRTARGSTLISGRKDGSSLTSVNVPHFVHAMPDGSIRVVKVVSKSPKVNTSKRRSSLAGIVMEEFGPDGVKRRTSDLLPEYTAKWTETESFIEEALSADPDMAGEYYHVEEIRPLGSSGSLSSWVLAVDSYLGGAHPFSSQRVFVVDAESGGLFDMATAFEGRDLPKELLGESFDSACVRKDCGAAPLESPGGEVVWVDVLGAEFGSCEGRYQIMKIEPPTGVEKPARGTMLIENRDLMVPNRGTIERGVMDFRATPSDDMAVIAMALGNHDEIHVPWVQTRVKSDRSKTREVRFWSEGMKESAVVGRLPDIHSVQFPSAGDGSVQLVNAARGLPR